MDDDVNKKPRLVGIGDDFVITCNDDDDDDDNNDADDYGGYSNGTDDDDDDVVIIEESTSLKASKHAKPVKTEPSSRRTRQSQPQPVSQTPGPATRQTPGPTTRQTREPVRLSVNDMPNPRAARQSPAQPPSLRGQSFYNQQAQRGRPTVHSARQRYANIYNIQPQAPAPEIHPSRLDASLCDVSELPLSQENLAMAGTEPLINIAPIETDIAMEPDEDEMDHNDDVDGGVSSSDNEKPSIDETEAQLISSPAPKKSQDAQNSLRSAIKKTPTVVLRPSTVTTVQVVDSDSIPELKKQVTDVKQRLDGVLNNVHQLLTLYYPELEIDENKIEDILPAFIKSYKETVNQKKSVDNSIENGYVCKIETEDNANDVSNEDSNDGASSPIIFSKSDDEDEINVVPVIEDDDDQVSLDQELSDLAKTVTDNDDTESTSERDETVTDKSEEKITNKDLSDENHLDIDIKISSSQEERNLAEKDGTSKEVSSEDCADANNSDIGKTAKHCTDDGTADVDNSEKNSNDTETSGQNVDEEISEQSEECASKNADHKHDATTAVAGADAGASADHDQSNSALSSKDITTNEQEQAMDGQSSDDAKIEPSEENDNKQPNNEHDNSDSSDPTSTTDVETVNVTVMIQDKCVSESTSDSKCTATSTENSTDGVDSTCIEEAVTSDSPEETSNGKVNDEKVEVLDADDDTGKVCGSDVTSGKKDDVKDSDLQKNDADTRAEAKDEEECMSKDKQSKEKVEKKTKEDVSDGEECIIDDTEDETENKEDSAEVVADTEITNSGVKENDVSEAMDVSNLTKSTDSNVECKERRNGLDNGMETDGDTPIHEDGTTSNTTNVTDKNQPNTGSNTVESTNNDT